MKRRNFLKTAAAFASAPALPVKLGATPLPVSPEQYAKAAHWAGLWVHSTAATYKNMLGVDQAVGEAVFKRLQADGIVGAMDANGIARAMVPHYELPEVAARLKKALAPKNSAKVGASAKAGTSKRLDLKEVSKRLELEEDAPEESQSDLETEMRPKPRPDVRAT